MLYLNGKLIYDVQLSSSECVTIGAERLTGTRWRRNQYNGYNPGQITICNGTLWYSKTADFATLTCSEILSKILIRCVIARFAVFAMCNAKRGPGENTERNNLRT